MITRDHSRLERTAVEIAVLAATRRRESRCLLTLRESPKDLVVQPERRMHGTDDSDMALGRGAAGDTKSFGKGRDRARRAELPTARFACFGRFDGKLLIQFE